MYGVSENVRGMEKRGSACGSLSCPTLPTLGSWSGPDSYEIFPFEDPLYITNEIFCELFSTAPRGRVELG